MRLINIYFSFLLIIVLSGCSSRKEITFTDRWDTLRVLNNPHKGWYHHLLDNGISKYPIKSDSVFASFPGMDHLYLRLAWSYLEPKEGKFDWHYIDDVKEKYVPKGYNIAFRITCSETGTYPDNVGEEVAGVQYAAPSWVKKAGAKGTTIKSRNGNMVWVPNWDDPVYLEKLDQFHKAFAERYDGQPWVSYVDIGSIGDWGEGHTSFTTGIPPTLSEIKANIGVFLKNYKKSQLVCNDDLLAENKSDENIKELLEFIRSKGITLRDDSPLVEYYIQNFLKTWSVSHPDLYDPLYLTGPIVFELQHYAGVKNDGNWLGKNGSQTIGKYGCSGALIMRRAIETMHATYIGYHGYTEEWLSDNPDLTKELANLCGYWYFPVSASYPSVMHRGENELSLVWLNKGVAPAYNTFDLIMRFESKDLKNSFDLPPVNSGNNNWLPGISKMEKYNIEIPATAKKGSYTMKFRLEERIGENIEPIQTGIRESAIDPDGFAEMGLVTIR